MTRNAQQRTLGSLQQLNAALAANSASLPNLEGQRQEFDDMVTATLEAFTRQGQLTAEKQEASQALKTLLTEASRHATVLRLAVKAHYGIRSEKLVEFGLQPFRVDSRIEPRSRTAGPSRSCTTQRSRFPANWPASRASRPSAPCSAPGIS